ncbi:MAG: outer membrane protein assembly factor [Betaproteobacteria bacterium]
MPAPALLALALAGAAQPHAADAPAEIVRAVRIEAEAPARLAPLVTLSAGRPLDREAVRRAVELIFATGRFEDVRVDLERGAPGSGVTVVFRPRPAPLLRAVRVAGDRVLKPRQIVRIARLRAGEPLWPSRLERAARDVALALVARGHLEALVEPEALPVAGGADALFRIRAGPRVRVGATSVEGLAVPGVALEPLLRPRRGEIYRKDRAQAAAEAMRRRLADAGHWRAAVTLRETYDPAQATMRLVFHTEPGPRLRLAARGAPLGEKLLAEVRTLVREGGAGSDALEAGAERIESYLRAQGYRDAAARALTEPDAAGEAIVYELAAGARALASTVVLRGADPQLLEGLRTQPGRPIEDAALEEDQRALVTQLEARGHFQARVESDVPEGGGQLPVVFVAQPGPRALVKAFVLEGPPLPGSAEEGGPTELAVRAGQPYRLADVARSRDTLLAAWRRAGYLDARVRTEVELSEAHDEASVRVVVEPGEQTLVDHVVLAGLGHTKDVTVQREMVLRPGQPFSFERVLESQRRLSALGIFERVSITELDPTRERRDVVVSVQEAPPTSVSWGVGYSEQDRLRGSVELARRNLGGLARTASFFARGSFRGSRLLANLREPWLFGRKLDSFATVFWEEESRTSFDYNRKGASLQVARALDARTSLILRYQLQDTNVFNVAVPIEEIDRQYRTYTVSGPSASVVFDTRDDPLEPRRGSFLSTDLQLSLKALGGQSYLRGFFQATHVRRLRVGLVLVVSGRLGLAGTFGDTPPLLPLPERFFAGGDFGPRGFRFDMVGPQLTAQDGQVYPTGGNALVFGGAEMRYDLTGALQVASFLDLGNVYPEARDIELGALRRSAGVGLRYRTPIGPVRLDWGYVLDHEQGEPRSRLHLTIGHAF